MMADRANTFHGDASKRFKLAVLTAAGGLFLLWIATHLYLLIAAQNGLLRFFLTTFFSLLILLRPKPRGLSSSAAPGLVAAAALLGLAGVIGGIVFHVHHFEWIGLLLLTGACLAWSLPPAYGRDTVFALCLVYWAHPLPDQIFAPLQFAMQKISVQGAEWILHLGNVRVWADGFVLHTGFDAFDVPVWCSGMRTATTVFLLALGLGILNRLAWYECAAAMILALAQALALNVLRIATMVLFSPAHADPSGTRFLHNSSGILVVAAVFVTYLEITFWKQFRNRRALRKGLLPPGMTALTDRPPFWHHLASHWRAIAFGILSIVVVAAIAYRSRPAHRISMIRDVAIALRDNGRLPEAERAAALVQQAFPDDNGWRMVRIRLLLLRGKYEEVLAALDTVPAVDALQQTQKDILQAYALMGLKKLREAADIVQKLPEELKHSNPQVAMILAEWSYYANDPDRVAEYIVPAARWQPNESRVRALYPYLRAHQLWQAIVKTDSRQPYQDPAQAFAAMEAYMNCNRTGDLANLAVYALNHWPRDPRVLEPLFFLAMNRRQAEWEERFARHLLTSLGDQPNPDLLYRYFDKCFALARPDLAWALYRRLRALDPSHPGLPMVVVKHGDEWFFFRRGHLGLSTRRDGAPADTRPYLLLAAAIPSLRPLYEDVPLIQELSPTNTVPFRKRMLGEALAEFEARDGNDQLPLDLQYEYVNALEIAEQPEKARAMLRKIAQQHPERSTGNRVFMSEIYERQGDWQNVYETLRGYEETAELQLVPLLRLCRAQLNLHLGLMAVRNAEIAARRFPDSSLAAGVLADALIRHETPELALMRLQRPRAWHDRRLEIRLAECLYATERYREADLYCQSVMISPMPNLASQPQRAVLPPAEVALLWHQLYTPATRDFDANAAILRENLKATSNPFLRDMMSLWLECYGTGGAGSAADTARWAAAGRDPAEKATLLNQLTLLLCWQDNIAAARAAAEQATALLPDCPALWRPLISLSDAAPGVISAARKACPDDSEIWLAELVANTRTNAPPGGGKPAPTGEDAEGWALESVRQAIAGAAITPAAMTRAGEYLSRIGMRRAASAAARDAVARANGLLPAYILGVRCALKDEDKPWAVECTKKAISSSLNPPAFFYEKLVRLKSADEPIATDEDMVHALRRMRQAEPDNPIWMQMLGYVCYRRGGVEMIFALHEMSAAVSKGTTSRLAYLVGAEAARVLGNLGRARDLLKRGLEKYPDDLPMLNNLVYVLALDKNTVPEALQSLPALLRRAPDDLRVMDTASVVYLRAGQAGPADEILRRALARTEPPSKEWFRATLRLAELADLRGDHNRARQLVEEGVRQARGIPDEDIQAANLIISDLSSATNKPADRPFEERNMPDFPP